ncbi:MAG TPA: DUF5916 domain-containing protein [Gemmatimonadaceae bacterium]|nr:DUF5916 domain-containing protein [Gemmatimonadaceae bacterium]
MRRVGWAAGGGALLAMLSAPAAAQGRGELELPRLTAPVRVDGVLDDSAWAGVPALPLTMYAPRFGGAPVERTEIRVAYDDEYLYAAGWFYDSRPDGIRVNSLYRDRWSGDDTFALFVDGFNDNENALWFYTNPAGVRMDESISGDGRTSNSSWNAVWDVATRVTGAGWFAEVRIPLSSLGFQERDGRVVMGLTVTRLVARSSERVTFPAIDPRYEFRQPSVMQDVVLRGVRPRRPVYVTPYALGGMDRTAALPPGGAAYASRQHAVREVGADLRYDVTDNLHLDLSANTDFAQVEADDEQVNLTRFPLFFPEKRQFFQERAGVFEFDFGSGGRLFHSRRIGLAPDRTPIRMLGGARVVARAGAWDVAALDVQTARRGDEIPSENLGVVRVRRRVLNPYSYAGGMVTSRATADGGYNAAAGLDASLRFFGTDYLTLRGAATFDDADTAAGGAGAGARPGLADRGQLYAQWQRPSSRGLTYTFSLQRIGEVYRPELGFLPRSDVTRLSLFSEYAVLPEHSRLRSHGPGAIAFYWLRNADRSLETYYMAYWWSYAFRSGGRGWVEVIHNYEDVREAFTLGKGAAVEPGVFHFPELWFNFQPPPGPLLRTEVDLRAGQFYDGWRTQLTLDPTWNLSRHLEVGGSYQLNRIRFPDRDAALDAHVVRLRVGVAANARLSAVALTQLNSVDERAGVNLRVRYNFREGSDLWLVYDEGLNTDRSAADAGEPPRPRSDARFLRVKLTHTFVP